MQIVHVRKAKQARKVISDKIDDENWKILVEILKKKPVRYPPVLKKIPGGFRNFSNGRRRVSG